MVKSVLLLSDYEKKEKKKTKETTNFNIWLD